MRINEEIHIREVRVTSATGEQLGIMQTRDALRLAEEQHLDLVEVAPKARPPVCRIMDFGKYRYEQQKREKEAKKKQKVITIKEVKLRPNIEQHDFDVKLKNALRFVEEGNKVKVTIMFRGREMSHQELGRDVLDRVAECMKDKVQIERGAKVEGRNMTMVLAPKPAGKTPKAKPDGVRPPLTPGASASAAPLQLYDLQGQQLSASAPTPRGIYIVREDGRSRKVMR